MVGVVWDWFYIIVKFRGFGVLRDGYGLRCEFIFFRVGLFLEI